MCKSKLRSEEFVFPTLHWEQGFRNHQVVFHLHHNVPPAQAIMNSNPPTYRPGKKNIRFCTTPNFCKQPFVNGKVASPKSITGNTTASNNFSRKTKKTCLFVQQDMFVFVKFVPSNPQAMGKYINFSRQKKLRPKLRPEYLHCFGMNSPYHFSTYINKLFSPSLVANHKVQVPESKLPTYKSNHLKKWHSIYPFIYSPRVR